MTRREWELSAERPYSGSFRSRYSSICNECGSLILPGQEVCWVYWREDPRGRAVIHLECVDVSKWK